MSNSVASAKPNAIIMPEVMALAVHSQSAVLLNEDGELQNLSHEQARLLIHKQPVLVCHAPYCRSRIGLNEFQSFDVLELFSFVHPAKFCVPTPAGLAKALGLNAPAEFEDYPYSLLESVQALLTDLAAEEKSDKKLNPAEIANVMGLQGKGWVWTPYVMAAMGCEYDPAVPVIAKTAMNVWKYLPEWAEDAPPPPPSHHDVSGDEAKTRLQQLLGSNSEKRPQQYDYTQTIAEAFAPGENLDSPHMVLAEAGTGVGKTIGYIAPASVWAEKNQAPVWISTYTKNLQRQVYQELDRLYPDPVNKSSKVAVRKGRENYLCLLNLDDHVAGAAIAKHPNQAIAAGLLARWAEASETGDMNGGDFPGWLSAILGYKHSIGLSDRRGECIYSACDHYHKCFVERASRRAKHADIVVANHALVMIQTALASPGDDMPGRYIFDEGHHLFDAADSAFAAHLTARETHDLRRWILGVEGGKRSRARGLAKRVEDLVEGNQVAINALTDAQTIAHNLPAFGWSHRLKDKKPVGITEDFLLLVYNQVYARAKGTEGPYSIETGTFPMLEGLDKAALSLKTQFSKLQKAINILAEQLHKKLTDESSDLNTDTRKRLDSVCASLRRKSNMQLAAWISMLEDLLFGQEAAEMISWMEVERIEGQAIDLGLYRHYIDPMIPFAKALKPHTHGLAITSATLQDEDGSWEDVKQKTGALALNEHPTLFSAKSPYNYAEQTRIFIVNDVDRNDMDQVAAAYRVLFEAAGGGSLGLFTAINRLRAVHQRISGKLEEADIHLYAQHCDGIDTGTLVDIFKDDEHSCLLGTDAVRDGIDVPGGSLRLLVYDRTPWPRPTILHKSRRNHFGGSRYDDQMIRLKLKQAYGRLIRRADDKGVFVMLDPSLPSRLHGAFPDDVEIVKTGLSDIAAETKRFI